MQLQHHFEFYLTPPGQFAIPKLLIEVTNRIEDQPYSKSMNENLILAIRHSIFSESMSFHEWQPEKSLWIFARELTEQQDSDSLA